MNSTFGKTVIKPVETDTVVKGSQEEFENHISLNYNYVGSGLEVNGRYYTKKV